MNKILLIIGIVLGVITAWLLYSYTTTLERAQVSAPFIKLSASKSLSTGEVLEVEYLETVSLPEKFSSLASFAIPDTSDNRNWIVGKRVNKDIKAGSLLQYDFFSDEPEKRFSATIEKNKRAMTIPVSPSSAVSYFVEPGSRVDLVGTLRLDLTKDVEVPIPSSIGENFGSNSAVVPQLISRSVTKTLLQNVKVLAVGRATTRGSYLGVVDAGYRTITIEVTPYQAEKLIFAMSNVLSELVVLLRNPADDAVEEIPVVNWKDLN
ncbi:MAG: Flp pilus assembly protein CpaB [Gammaproteobacteria bacterium]|nr:Flp pilus assembly protein CpaB [Gammaproteobacteria bacterium]